ncbi:MAG: hypothetical protein ACK5CY_05960 [Bacteroidia bacterium]|jgi:hypothetical protein
MTDYMHFRGRYRAYFKPVNEQQIRNNSFYTLKWQCIDIDSLEVIETRKIERERVGDFIYLPRLKAKSRFSILRLFQLNACDVVIHGNEKIAFSEDLEHVVLSNQSGERREGKSQFRDIRHIRINYETGYCEGTIYFSVPFKQSIVPQTAPQQNLNPVINISEEPKESTIAIPDLVVNPEVSSPNFKTDIGFKGCLSNLRRIFKFFVYMLILYAFIGLLAKAFKVRFGGTDTSEDNTNIENSKPKLNPKQDTLAPVDTWDYLTQHHIRWKDFEIQQYNAKYTTSSELFKASQRLHAPFSNVKTNDALRYWNSVYTEFSSRDSRKLDSLYTYFSKEREKKQLNTLQTSEMVITFIQEIPYCLIHDGTCEEANKMAPFIQEYHSSNKPCLAEVIAGVQSPYEFIHNLKGDCDTRSLLAYTLLSRLGIAASIWVSDVYGHSILGVGIGTGSRNVKSIGGMRHTAVELTAKGFRLGMISPDHTNMANWNIALYNNQ